VPNVCHAPTRITGAGRFAIKPAGSQLYLLVSFPLYSRLFPNYAVLTKKFSGNKTAGY
jgi:hypothetical protein